RETTAFKEQIQSVQTSEQLLDNRNLLKVALGAFGLDDDLNNREFIRQVLDSDLSDAKSLANRLADKSYLALAQAFNFKGTSGPKIDSTTDKDAVAAKLAKVQEPADLLSDPGLLRATLKSFGLEADSGNTFFLQKVLTSDLTDKSSFANRLSDKRYVDLAKTFDFQGKVQAKDNLIDYAKDFSDEVLYFTSPDKLLSDTKFQNATLAIFGLENDNNILYKTDFLKNVLESNPYDENSFAATQEDPRFLALSKAFAFGDPDRETTDALTGEVTLEKSAAVKLVEAMETRSTGFEKSSDLFNNVSLTLTVMNFFDLPQGVGKIDLATRILDSDRSDPNSLLNVYPDKRYKAFADAINVQATSSERTYPSGFADTITRNYLDRQFEKQIGESDANMRIALSLERDLSDLTTRTKSTDAQWFGVMASKPLRTVFETAFNLPSSFGTLDIDRQLSEFKKRSSQYFGVEKVSDFTNPEKLDQLRRRFLLTGDQQANNSLSSSASIVLSLLNGYAQ
ncbi:MAG: DUF1217 domain-containing protein, partial [Rhodobacterales bacterium]